MTKPKPYCSSLLPCCVVIQAVENMYFSKEDERLLSKLLSKVKKQTAVSDASEATQSAVAEEAALRSIVAKYKLSKEDFQALLDWKHAHY